MSGENPRYKVEFKVIDGGRKIPFLAAWDRGDRVSASIDKRIKRFKIEEEDGTVTLFTRGSDGKWNAYVNLYDNGAGGGAPRAQTAPRQQAASFDDGPDYSDDVPF